MYLEGLGREVSMFIDECGDSLETLCEMEVEVEKLHKDCNISKTVGTTVRTLGTTAVVFGPLFLPALIAGGVAAGAGALCATITDEVRKGKSR